MEERETRKKQGTGEGEASKKLEYVSHPFEPVFDKESRVLILGSIPSPKSRENGFYYGHPRNRFWPVLARSLRRWRKSVQWRCAAMWRCGMCWRVVRSTARTMPASAALRPTI